MKHHVNRWVLALGLGMGLLGNSLAQDHGSKDEAMALTQAAVQKVQSAGAESAYKAFTEDKAAWAKKDLYVFALDLSGNVLAHGGNAKLVGKNMLPLKDSNGKEFIKEVLDVAKSKGKGWVDYDWVNPTTKKIEPKSSYIQRVPNADALVAVGIYR